MWKSYQVNQTTDIFWRGDNGAGHDSTADQTLLDTAQMTVAGRFPTICSVTRLHYAAEMNFSDENLIFPSTQTAQTVSQNWKKKIQSTYSNSSRLEVIRRPYSSLEITVTTDRLQP